MTLRAPAAATAGAEYEDTRCSPLDAVLPWRTHRVGLVLLDVEGHEHAALRGASALLARWRPMLAIELRDGSAGAAAVRTMLGALGYRPTHRCSGLVFFE